MTFRLDRSSDKSQDKSLSPMHCLHYALLKYRENASDRANLVSYLFHHSMVPPDILGKTKTQCEYFVRMHIQIRRFISAVFPLLILLR